MTFCDAEGWAVFSQRRAMDFTMCFQDSVLTVIPNVLLLALLSPRVHKVLGKGPLEGVKASPVFYFKMLTLLATMSVQVAILAEIVSMGSYSTSEVLSTIMYLVASLGAAVLHYFEFFNMVNPSSGLTVFWLFTGLVSIFPTRAWIQDSPAGLQGGGEPHSIPVFKLVFTILSFLMFFLEMIPRPSRRSLKREEVIPGLENLIQLNPSPEPFSNYFVRITFFWVLPLLRLGKTKTLKMEDMYDLDPELLSYPLYMASKAKMDADEAATLQKIKQGKEDQAKALKEGTAAKESGDEVKKTQKGKIRLVTAILHSDGYRCMWACIPRLLYIGAHYIRPILFSQLIVFVNSYSRLGNSDEVPQVPWIGFGLVIAVFCSDVFSSLFEVQFRSICFDSSFKSRGILVSLVYSKALKLSLTNKQEGVGAIVNHMMSDVQNVVAFFEILHLSWSSILEIIIILVLLWGQVRYALIASVGVVVVIMVITALCSPHVSQALKSLMKTCDERTKLVTELVSFIRSIKLYAWEPYFVDRITAVRKHQLNKLRVFFHWITGTFTLYRSLAPFCAFATLSAYTIIAEESETMDFQKIFTTMTLLNMLQEPVSTMSQSMSSIVAGIVSYKRVIDFLNSEEIDDENVIRHMGIETSEFAYEIENGTFGWYSPEAIQRAIEKKEKEAQEKIKTDATEAKKNRNTTLVDIKDDQFALSNVKGDMPEVDSPSLTILDIQDEKRVVATAPATAEEICGTMGPVLHDIDLKIRRGALTAVVGRVGEGKSSLVGALLGEMHRYTGTVRTCGSLAYVSQSAWILKDTVRNNILFGKEYNRERYLQTIRACALIHDLTMLVNGDKTVIGEKGINLSGGQKQRISIARAVYADCDVYIFDDPLSAVDAHVDYHIFDQAIASILARKTRILITNSVSHLQEVDQIVVIKAGRISQNGAYDQLIQDVDGDFFHLIQESKVVDSGKEKSDNQEENTDSDSLDAHEGSEEEATFGFGSDEKNGGVMDPSEALVNQPSFKRSKSSTIEVKEDEFVLEDSDEVSDEIEAQTRVGWPVYKFYISTMGVLGVTTLLLISLLYFGFNFATLFWLENWGDENEKAAEEGTPPTLSIHWFILSYFGWILASALTLAICITHNMTYMARKASKKLHSCMLMALVRAPMSFFDVTSSGNIVNRFAHHLREMDMDLPLQFLNLLFICTVTTTMVVFCIMASPWFVLAMIPLSYIYFQLGGFFLVSSRELRRLNSAARSPMYAHFSETLAGLVTIRAFKDADRFAIQATKLLDRSQQTDYLTDATARWLQITLDFMSTLVVSMVAFLAVVERNSPRVGYFSIVLSQIGELTSIVSELLNIICSIETSIVSVELIREFCNLTPEACDVIPDSKTPESWPQKGDIIFSNYSTRYREGLDLVLNNIDVSIQGGSRVGVVGRTGAGKSSITLALFRIIEAASGSISIDGLDISTLGLTELRSRITIIPQDPFLFGDTVRTNLDPFCKHSDAEIWDVLDSASLKPYIMTFPDGLSTMIENGGGNMSLGQRQLMSLARAMLFKNTRVLCLDEATAALDIETDNAIQKALRDKFKNCTVLTIAHRINTIMDSDKILVLDKGCVVEYDTPEVLLQDKDSIFYSLAYKSGNP